MKKKEMTKVTESVEKAVKRFLRHTKFYEYADDMVVGVYSTLNGLLVRMKTSQANLNDMSENPLSELELSGYDLLGITGNLKHHIVVKEHDVNNGKKLSVTFYDVSHPGNTEAKDSNKEVPLYANMQKELIEDVEEDIPTDTAHNGIVVTESDLDQEIEGYLDTFHKGTTKAITDIDLHERPNVLLSGTIDTIAKVIVQDYEDHGMYYDASTIKNSAKFGLYKILVEMAYRSSALKNYLVATAEESKKNFKMYMETMETVKTKQDEIFALKRENAELKDRIGDLQKKLDGETTTQESSNTTNDETPELTSKEFLRMNYFNAYIATAGSKPGSIITLGTLMTFVQSILKEEHRRYPFVSSLKKEGVSRREYELLRDEKLNDVTFKVNQLRAILNLYADGKPETILHMQNVLWQAPFRLYKNATEEETHKVLNELRADVIKGQDAAQGTKKNEEQTLSEA